MTKETYNKVSAEVLNGLGQEAQKFYEYHQVQTREGVGLGSAGFEREQHRYALGNLRRLIDAGVSREAIEIMVQERDLSYESVNHVQRDDKGIRLADWLNTRDVPAKVLRELGIEEGDLKKIKQIPSFSDYIDIGFRTYQGPNHIGPGW